MLLDFDVRTCSRQCAETGKALQPGDVYFSALVLQPAELEAGTAPASRAAAHEAIRHDYSAEAWQGPPADNLGWWRSRVPLKNEKPKLAPGEVMLNLLAALADQPVDSQFRYVLGLLLIRKRLLRRDDAHRNEANQEVLTLVAPKRDEQFEVIVDEPNPEQAEQIQQRMIDLLYGDGE